MIADHSGAGGIVGVVNNAGALGQTLAGCLDGLVNSRWVSRATGILEAYRGEWNLSCQDIIECLSVKLSIVCAGAARRQCHHGDTDFVVQTVVGDRAS